ncbi:MAG: hypothetical protein R3A10_12605 [Caldilineaceae bacterium]
MELVRQSDRIFERAAPAALASGAVTMLQVWGHLTFAGARVFEEQLPAVGAAQRPVVILRMRGRTEIGSNRSLACWSAMLDRYRLRAASSCWPA